MSITLFLSLSSSNSAKNSSSSIIDSWRLLFGFHNILIFFLRASNKIPLLESTLRTRQYFPLSFAAFVHSSPSEMLNSSSSVTLSFCHNVSSSSAIPVLIPHSYNKKKTVPDLTTQRVEDHFTPTMTVGPTLLLRAKSSRALSWSKFPFAKKLIPKMKEEKLSVSRARQN